MYVIESKALTIGLSKDLSRQKIILDHSKTCFILLITVTEHIMKHFNTQNRNYIHVLLPILPFVLSVTPVECLDHAKLF